MMVYIGQLVNTSFNVNHWYRTFEMVRLANSPMEAAKIGRDRRNRLRADWEDDMSLYPMKAKFIKGNING